MSDKVTPLHGASISDAISAAIKEMSREMPSFVKAQKALAELRMNSYKAHIEAGFTDEQAIELCKNPFC